MDTHNINNRRKKRNYVNLIFKIQLLERVKAGKNIFERETGKNYLETRGYFNEELNLSSIS